MSKTPVIGVMTCTRAKHEKTPELLELAVGQKYMAPLLKRGALPFGLPNFGDETPFEAIMDQIDGLLLTGSLSNVHPDLYDGEVGPNSYPFDRHRDACTWGLLDRCFERGVPVFGVCRGFQEFNVYFGGSLHQMVHEAPGCFDHRHPTSDNPAIKYGPWHPVEVTKGGKLAAALGGEDPVTVNSLHLQGVDRVGKGLTVEAVASDGLVEAVSVTDAKAFALAVQWHPEAVENNAVSEALFDAFVDACKASD